MDPYRMVFINLMGSLLVLSGALFYRYVFPKRKINLFILLLLISILPIISIFRTGVYESGDFTLHVRRTMEFYNMLSQGNFIPTWAGDLNATYGYPLFAFDYILPYYLISFFHFFGFSFVMSLKLFLAINLVLSGVFMYLFTKNHFKNAFTAFTVAVFYLFTPYHLIDVHFRITIGEILAYTLVPLIFYFVSKLIESKKNVYLLLSGFMLGLLILSHIAIAIYLVPAIFIYIYLTLRKTAKATFYSLKIILVSLLVAAFQWTAPLIYYPYLYVTTYPSSYLPHFPSIAELLYSPWRLGLLFQGPHGELSFLVGYAQVLAILLIISYLFRKGVHKTQKKIIASWLLLLFVYIFFITPYSIFIWKYMPIIKDSGSQRILIPVAFCTSLLAGYLTVIIKKKTWLIYGLIFLAIGLTILNWGNRRVIPTINDAILRSNLSLGETWADQHFYALPKWINSKQLFFPKIPSSRLDILDGKANIEEVSRNATLHIYEVDALTPLKLRENTLYFPGWTATLNGKSVLLKPDSNGAIALDLPKGKGDLKISYHDLFFFQLTKILSVISAISIILYALIYFLNKRFNIYAKVLNKG
jgi:hypothetical protein